MLLLGLVLSIASETVAAVETEGFLLPCSGTRTGDGTSAPREIQASPLRPPSQPCDRVLGGTLPGWTIGDCCGSRSASRVDGSGRQLVCLSCLSFPLPSPKSSRRTLGSVPNPRLERGRRPLTSRRSGWDCISCRLLCTVRRYFRIISWPRGVARSEERR